MPNSRYNQGQPQKPLLEQLEDDLPPSATKALLDLFNRSGIVGKAFAVVVGAALLKGLYDQIKK